MIEIIALSFFIMSASLIGVVTVWHRAGSFIEKNIDYLVSFSAGVFLVFLYGLATEAVEHAATPTWGLSWLLFGAIGIWILFRVLPAGAHIHAYEHADHSPLDARRLLLTDGIHNAADGIFLTASYVVSPGLALIAGISIFIHEALQEISEFFVLRDAGYSTRGALVVNFLVSATILIGAVGAYFLLDLFEFLEGPLLGIAAGGILVVVLGDLIPHSLKSSTDRTHTIKHVVWFAIGGVLMFAVSLGTSLLGVH